MVTFPRRPDPIPFLFSAAAPFFHGVHVETAIQDEVGMQYVINASPQYREEKW